MSIQTNRDAAFARSTSRRRWPSQQRGIEVEAELGRLHRQLGVAGPAEDVEVVARHLGGLRGVADALAEAGEHGADRAPAQRVGGGERVVDASPRA